MRRRSLWRENLQKVKQDVKLILGWKQIGKKDQKGTTPNRDSILIKTNCKGKEKEKAKRGKAKIRNKERRKKQTDLGANKLRCR